MGSDLLWRLLVRVGIHVGGFGLGVKISVGGLG